MPKLKRKVDESSEVGVDAMVITGCVDDAGGKIRDGEYRALTVQLLHLRNEIFSGDPMDKETFTNEYLNGLGDYERQIAKEEGIDIGW